MGRGQSLALALVSVEGSPSSEPSELATRGVTTDQHWASAVHIASRPETRPSTWSHCITELTLYMENSSQESGVEGQLLFRSGRPCPPASYSICMMYMTRFVA